MELIIVGLLLYALGCLIERGIRRYQLRTSNKWRETWTGK